MTKRYILTKTQHTGDCIEKQAERELVRSEMLVKHPEANKFDFMPLSEVMFIDYAQQIPPSFVVYWPCECVS